MSEGRQLRKKEKADDDDNLQGESRASYAELELEKNVELICQKKTQFESEAKIAREDEANARQSASRALLSGNKALADAFRKTAKDKG